MTEYSCYHYHSNRCAKIYIFIKSNNLIKVIINYVYELGEDYDTYDFVMTEEELKRYSNLYECYNISLQLTQNINNPIDDEDGIKIMKKRIWKGMYITKDYESIDTYVPKYMLRFGAKDKSVSEENIDIDKIEEMSENSKKIKELLENM